MCGDIDDFIDALDTAFEEQWGQLTLTRSQVEMIRTPTRVVLSRRFQVLVSLKGQVWRKVQVEVAPDEGCAGALPEAIPAPRLEPCGLPTPDALVAIATRYQKLHAASDPLDPPTWVNDRPRDVVDLLLRSLIESDGEPSLSRIRPAAAAVFDARAADARALDRPVRSWPPHVTADGHGPRDYAAAVRDDGLSMPLDEAVAAVNEWIVQIDRAKYVSAPMSISAWAQVSLRRCAW